VKDSSSIMPGTLPKHYNTK